MGPYPGWGAVAMPTRPSGRLEQAGELLIEAPPGLGIAPPVKTRPKRPDPPLTQDRAGLDGSRIGLGGEPACLVDVLLLELHEASSSSASDRRRVRDASSAANASCRVRSAAVSLPSCR